MATGSYEGSPTNGRHPRSSTNTSFHEVVQRLVWRLLPLSNPYARPKERRTVHARRRVNARGNEGEATGVSEARSHRRRGTKTPTLLAVAARQNTTRSASGMSIRQSGLERRETLGPPVLPRRARDSARYPRGESRGSEPGTHEVRVHVVRSSGRRRLDASRVFSSAGSQVPVEEEGASPEEVRSTA